MLLSKAVEGFLFDFSLSHSSSTAYRVYNPVLRHLMRFLGDVEIETITPAQLKAFLHYLKNTYTPARVKASTRQGKPLSPASVDNHWKGLRSFFRWCHLTGLVKINPAAALPRPHFTQYDVNGFSLEEIQRLVKFAQYSTAQRRDMVITIRRVNAKRNLAILLILLDTGVRLGELARLTIGDIHLSAREIFITPYGTGRKTKSRTIPISAQTCKAIWLYLASQTNTPKPSDSLFNMQAHSIRGMIKTVGKKAMVPKTNPHRFRHTFAIEYLRNGGDVFTLQHILGHSTLEMVRRYLRILKTDVETAHRRASPVDHWRL